LASEDILELIYELNNTITTARNFSEIETRLTEILSQRIPVSLTDIWIIKEDKVYIYGKDETIPLTETPVNEIIKTKSYFYEKDLQKSKTFQISESFYKRGLRSVVYLPLLFEGKLFAVWVLCSDIPYAYKEDDLEFLKLLASQISAPLRTFILLEERKRELELLKTVSYLSRIVLSEIDTSSVFKKFSEELKKFIPFERLSIGIVEGENIRYAAVSEVIKNKKLS